MGEAGEIVYEPSLLAILPDGRIFMEVNKDVYHLGHDPWTTLRALAEISNTAKLLNWPLVSTNIERAEGVAREVDLGRQTQPRIANEGQFLATAQNLAVANISSVGGCVAW
jgi:hypothetical protein